MSNKLRIVPLGGLGEIGKNMMAVEYDKNIIIIDAGVMFPENDMWGVDLIIPDYTYLMDKLNTIRAVLITHGHEDHIGAISHLMTHVGAPVYSTPLTEGLIEVKLREAKVLHKVTLKTIQATDVLDIGPFKIEPFHVAHSIPDCVGFGITTPVGLIVQTGDYKFDHTPVDGWPPDFAKLAEFSRRGVLCLLADSTNATRPGWTPSETVITAAFDDLFATAEGRIIVATFASLISRIQQVANAAVQYGRKLAVTGRSMRDNVKMARRLGYLDIPDDLLVEVEQANKMPAKQVVIMATGSQGEPSAVLGRLATGTHRNLTVQKGDTVVMSAHPIPGNEEMIYRIVNRLLQRGAEVLYEPISEVHVSGHASQEEMKLMINLVRPKFMVPIHGELRHLTEHAKIAMQLGIPQERIAVVENGTILELDETSLTIGPRIPGGYVFVDGAGVGDITPAIMRDRERLANSGFVVAVLHLNNQGEMVGRPEILSKGFVSADDSAELWKRAEDNIGRSLKTAGVNLNREQLAARIQNDLSRYLYDETGRRPLVYASLQ